MNDQTRSSIADATFHPAALRRSVGLMELRDLSSVDPFAEEGLTADDVVEHASSSQDLLQFFLAIESSRQEMETYARYLDGAVRQNTHARMEAEATSRLRSDFLATMSHEIRTPLNGIIGMTAALLARQLGDVERDYVETIRQAGEALRAIVDDVLDLSKMDAGKLRLERADFELTRAVADALQIVQPAALQKSLPLIVKHDARLPRWFRGDVGRIRQILLNLLSNAVKFTSQGAIEIRTRVQVIDDDECELLFSVKDEGIGITEEQQRQLFQPFHQAEDSTSRNYGGTGLGLAICKRLAEQMGGQIGVTSRYGEGAIFWFTVRASVGIEPKHDIVRPEPILAQPAEAKSARILLVEDNRINQKVAMLMLNNLGYRADVASNGIEALNALDIASYDLIIMDCMMPEMNGIEATKRLRAGLSGNSVPVIAMTARAFEEDRLACLAAGMNDFISKPVNESELDAKLAFWLSADSIQQPS